MLKTFERMKTKKARSKDIQGEPLDYRQNHIRSFLKEHPAIGITQIEGICKLPKDTMRHFMKNRRSLPEKYLETVEVELSNYGFTPLNEE